MMNESDVLLSTISPTAWRSATDIATSTSNSLGRDLKKPWVSRTLKQLVANGQVEEMKNRNRLFYRRRGE